MYGPWQKMKGPRGGEGRVGGGVPPRGCAPPPNGEIALAACAVGLWVVVWLLGWAADGILYWDPPVFVDFVF